MQPDRLQFYWLFALLLPADCSLRFLCVVFPRTTQSHFQLSPATCQCFHWGSFKYVRGKSLAFLGLTLQEKSNKEKDGGWQIP